jgi:hypothetical protein
LIRTYHRLFSFFDAFGVSNSLRISIGAKAEEFDWCAGSDAGFADGDFNLLSGGVDAFEVGEQKAAADAAFVFHNHSVNFWIEIVESARLGRGEHIY